MQYDVFGRSTLLFVQPRQMQGQLLSKLAQAGSVRPRSMPNPFIKPRLRRARGTPGSSRWGARRSRGGTFLRGCRTEVCLHRRGGSSLDMQIASWGGLGRFAVGLVGDRPHRRAGRTIWRESARWHRVLTPGRWGHSRHRSSRSVAAWGTQAEVNAAGIEMFGQGRGIRLVDQASERLRCPGAHDVGVSSWASNSGPRNDIPDPGSSQYW